MVDITKNSNLPEYTSPPLSEVVIGMQFSRVPGYSSLHSSGVWDLFKDEFPIVQEHPYHNSDLEVFGGVNVNPNFKFQITPQAIGSRLWFATAKNDHLLQFQPDILFANWRKQNDEDSYPRFPSIIESYEKNINLLSDFVLKNFQHKLEVNQAEVTYVNLIPVSDFSEVSNWLSIVKNNDFPIESIMSDFSEVIKDDTGKPFARLKHDIATVIYSDGIQKAIRLSLTFRGQPNEKDVESGLVFVSLGREKIVDRFDKLTTNMAHKHWGKVDE